MPKIPTFTSQARPTAQVGSVKANLQIPLSQTITPVSYTHLRGPRD